MLGGFVFDATDQCETQERLLQYAAGLNRTVKGAVMATSRLVEARDPHTTGRQRRLAEHAG